MPPGYEELLIKNLAVNISPQYTSAILSHVTIKMARDAMSAIKTTNMVSPIMSLDPMMFGRRSNILNG
jgi:hypothetical protein